MGARRSARKLFCVVGECKSGLLLEELLSRIPIDELGGFVFCIAKNFIHVIEFVGITIECEIADTDKQRRNILDG